MATKAVWQEERQETMIIGESKQIKDVVSNIDVVAATDATVLISGESGTGKELVARSIHEKSGRRDKPMVVVNCAAIAPELFESEFFGHIKGSFTGASQDRLGRFQAADSGTIFLDEIGEVPLDLQGKLLRVLQEGEFERVGDDKSRDVDVRVLAATNRNLQSEAEQGNFRLDLFYRLNVFPIKIAPLRERLEDIGSLARHLFDELRVKHECGANDLTDENIESLMAYHYPGNVRELENIIERAMIVSRCGLLNFDLGQAFDAMTFPEKREKIKNFMAGTEEKILTYPDLKNLERENIIAALKKTDYKIYGKTGAASILDIKPTTLASRIKSMEIKMRPE